MLDFWWREFLDENHAQDGVFISDDAGSTWYQVLSFNDGTSTWRRQVIDLNAAAITHALTLNDHFLIKFQFYDDDPVTDDGYAIDELQVRPNAPPVLSWLGEGNYQQDGLHPESGDIRDDYTYRVVYSDFEGDPPDHVQVHIKKGGTDITGSPFAMTCESGDYAEGVSCIYVKEGLEQGSDYSYYFEAQADQGTAATPTTEIDAPDVTIIYRAYLPVVLRKSGGTTPPPPPPGDWTIEVVDEGVDGSIDLALDGNDTPHISYDAGGLFRAEKVGNDWDIDQLTDQAYRTSIDVDPQGYEHILLFDVSGHNTSLIYAHEDADGWHVGSLGLSGLYVGRYNNLAVDTGGQVHMIFSTWRCMAWVGSRCISWDPDELIYLDPTGDGQWQAVIAAYSPEYISLALDAEGNAHISYHNGYHKTLKYTQSGIFLVSPGGYTVDESAEVGRFTSVAADNQEPHISYYDVTNGDLKYAYGTGPDEWHLEWYTETVDSTEDVGQYTSIVLDDEGDPHITYYDAGNGDLRYAYRESGEWQFETVDSEGNVGMWSSLAIDQQGNLHVAYYDATNETVKYAHLIRPQ